MSNHTRYTFFFLFETHIETKAGKPIREPTPIHNEKYNIQHGIQFEEDKRLFRSKILTGKLDNWNYELQHSWQAILQLYTKAYHDDKSQALHYCQKALLGVALLVLEEGETVEQHLVEIPTENGQKLHFVKPKSGDFLFEVTKEGRETRACFYGFELRDQEDRQFKQNLQLSLAGSPSLAPLVLGELDPNPVLSVYALAYGDGSAKWNHILEEEVLWNSYSDRPSLLPTILARLLTAQWQFGRVDTDAKQLRGKLTQTNRSYANYADKDAEVRPYCAWTRQLEHHLQNMQVKNNEAIQVVSRVKGATRTLEINGKNLVKRLRQIQQKIEQNGWQISLQADGISRNIEWLPADDNLLLGRFYLNIQKLQDHQHYIEQLLDYLQGLQSKWRLYLEKRQTLSEEYLNTVGTILILLIAGGGVTLSSKNVTVSADDSVMYLVLAILLVPIGWRGLMWLTKQIYCLSHGLWIDNLREIIFCHPVLRWFQKINQNCTQQEDN